MPAQHGVLHEGQDRQGASPAHPRAARPHCRAAPRADRRGGCSTITAAIPIGQTAGAERFPTDSHFARMAGVAPIPVSSGRSDRHRRHRGGNRRINRALHVIAITRGRWDPETRAYLQRKEAEGKNRMETLKCLKRLLARHFHSILLQSPAGSTP